MIVGAYALPTPLSPDPSQNFGNFDMTGVVALDIDNNVDSTANTVVANCTGTLLSTGRHVLTAAHCVDSNRNGTPDVANMHVVFELPARNVIIDVPMANMQVAPGWNGSVNSGHDVAVLTLPVVAPIGAARHDIFRGNDEVGRWFYVVGYGDTGIAFDDEPDCNSRGNDVKRMGTNFFDDTEAGGNILDFDFDDDTSEWSGAADFTNWSSNGNEVDTSFGDSGGPSFLWGPSGLEVAAVTSDGTDANSCFGDNARNTRISTHKSWIDQVIDAPYQLVVNMNQQDRGNDGSADTISLHLDVTNTISVWFGQQMLHAVPLNKITGVTFVGSNDPETFSLHVGNMSLTTSVTGGLGTDELTLVGTTAADNVVFRGTNATVNSATVNFGDIESARILTSNGADNITIERTTSGTRVIVQSGEQNDTISVGSNLGLLAATVTVDGQGGVHDHVIFSDTLFGGGDTYRLRIGGLSVGRLPNVGLNYTGVETQTLRTGSGSDLVVVDSATNGVTKMVSAGQGQDRIQGPSTNNIWNITGINSGNLTGSVFFSSIENVTGGGLADRFQLAVSGNIDGVIDGGLGFDTLVGANNANRWTITANNAGNVDNVDFTSIENLFGGTSDDFFMITVNRRISGTIAGGLGNDWLDYSQFHATTVLSNGLELTFMIPVIVDLTTGVASNVLGSVSSIEHVRGGIGNDTITGNFANNILLGGAGNDTLTGNGGRDVIIGGTAADSISGGSGDDLLFDGTTSHDEHDFALRAIMSEWSSARSYSDRISNLRNGVAGTVRLNSSTVTWDSHVDSLTGGTDRDWFWGAPLLISLPSQPAPPPRDTITDRVMLAWPGFPDNRESLN
jgi:secreted trypsin-like serine protease/Ca2+-binding RTX toxin-like protein